MLICIRKLMHNPEKWIAYVPGDRKNISIILSIDSHIYLNRSYKIFLKKFGFFKSANNFATEFKN